MKILTNLCGIVLVACLIHDKFVAGAANTSYGGSSTVIGGGTTTTVPVDEPCRPLIHHQDSSSSVTTNFKTPVIRKLTNRGSVIQTSPIPPGDLPQFQGSMYSSTYNSMTNYSGEFTLVYYTHYGVGGVYNTTHRRFFYVPGLGFSFTGVCEGF